MPRLYTSDLQKLKEERGELHLNVDMTPSGELYVYDESTGKIVSAVKLKVNQEYGARPSATLTVYTRRKDLHRSEAGVRELLEEA